MTPSSAATAARDYPVPLEPVCPAHLLIAAGRHGAPESDVLGVGAVLGDPILWTEEVWVDGASLGPGAGGKGGAVPAGRAPMEVPPTHPRATLLCLRTVAGVVQGDSASRMVSASGVTVAAKAAGGAAHRGAAAAHARAALAAATGARATGGPAQWHAAAHVTHAAAAAALAARELVILVDWCVVSSDPGAGAALAAATASAVLPRGKAVRRPGAVLAAPSAGAHRAPWADEAGRWTLLEELKASYDAEA